MRITLLKIVKAQVFLIVFNIGFFGFIVYFIQILSWYPLHPNQAWADSKVGSWNQNYTVWRAAAPAKWTSLG